MRIRMIAKTEQVLVRGVLRYRGSSQVIDGACLHADPDARIVTDSPEWVCLALGISFPDPQVIAK